MKRINSISAIIILSIFLLTSCGFSNIPKKEATNKAKEDTPHIKLRFINSWGGVDSKADSLNQILNKFMSDNPTIEVINESMFGDDFLPKIKTDFASGNDPDVFGLWPGSDIRALVKADKVADLTDIINNDKKWKNSFGKSAWSYTTLNNKIYGLPLEIIYEGLFVNSDLFSKYNIKIPRTFDELKTAVVSFNQRGITPIAYNFFAEGTYLYQNIVAVLGGKEAVEHPFINGKINKSYLDAATYLQELYDLDAFSRDSYTMSSNERNNLFISKKAAMIVQGSWFNGSFDEKDNSVDIVPFPYIDPEHSSTLIYGLGCGAFYMSKVAEDDPEKKSASIKLLRTLTSKETAALLTSKTGMYSNVDISSFNIKYSRLAQKGILMVRDAKELVGPPDSFVERSIWEDIIVKNFPYVLEDKKTPGDFWKEVELAFAALK